MKVNKTLRISFITKKQLKSRQVLHIIFLKPQHKVYRGASILYINASFSNVPSFSKIPQPPGQNQQMVLNSVAYHPCPSRIVSRLRLTFIRHLTLINSNLIKPKKNCSSFLNKVSAISYFYCIQQIPVYNYICTFFIVIVLNIFVCSYCCKLFVIIFFYLLPQVMHSVFGVLPCAHVTCMG